MQIVNILEKMPSPNGGKTQDVSPTRGDWNVLYKEQPYRTGNETTEILNQDAACKPGWTEQNQKKD